MTWPAKILGWLGDGEHFHSQKGHDVAGMTFKTSLPRLQAIQLFCPSGQFLRGATLVETLSLGGFYAYLPSCWLTR
jgi:hypothetical protein